MFFHLSILIFNNKLWKEVKKNLKVLAVYILNLSNVCVFKNIKVPKTGEIGSPPKNVVLKLKLFKNFIGLLDFILLFKY